MDIVNKKRKGDGFLSGIIYGLIPHIGCIAFIVFSVLGVTAATSFFKPLLLNPYFFYILIIISLAFATISAIFYFKKQGFIVFSRANDGLEIGLLRGGLKRKWKYLLTLYGTTVSINLILFMFIFPIAANISSGSTFTASLLGAFGAGEELQLSDSESLTTLKVDIPCPGHAPLIIGELGDIDGISGIRFKFPNLFDVGYKPEETSVDEILSLDVFETYKATVINKDGTAEAVQAVGSSGQDQPLSSVGSCCNGVNVGGCGCGNTNCGINN